MKITHVLAMAAAAGLMLTGCDSSGGTRESIRAVGSSTVYPFATAAAELFVQSNPGMKSPIIESTGTGGGMKLFCAGLGADTPDMTHASRQMKASECQTDARAGTGNQYWIGKRWGCHGRRIAVDRTS